MFQKKYTSYTYIFRGTGKDYPRMYPWSAGKTPPRGYRERNRAYVPETCRKSTTARVQEKISREYTRGRPGKHHRAGTGKDSARIYPWPAGKMPPRGYRERFPANVPVASRENATARVQEKISRGYTRSRSEKHRRAGIGEKFPRIYPTTSRNISPRELYYTYRARKRTTQVRPLSPRKCTTRVSLIKPADISHPRLFAHAGA